MIIERKHGQIDLISIIVKREKRALYSGKKIKDG
jgi:hypothetical protein